MITKFFSSLVFTLLITNAIAQSNNDTYKPYNWNDDPNYSIVDVKDKPISKLLYKRKVDLKFNGNRLNEYNLLHEAIYLNSDDKIEEYNKIYIPYDIDDKLLKSKARVIYDGEVISTLDKSKLLQAENQETGRKYTYFAVEGIKKGSIIEYFYTLKTRPKLYGRKINIQTDVDTKEAKFELNIPENFVIKSKSFNGLDELESTTFNEVTSWTLNAKNIEGINDEEYALISAERKYLVYALDKNNYNNTKDISSYSSVSKNIYKQFNVDLRRRTEKKIEQIGEDLNLDLVKTVGEKIKRVEDYVKSNYQLNDIFNEKNSDLDEVVKNEVGNSRALTHLLYEIFKRNNISTEIVITCSREDMKFDPKFEANNFLREFLLYFPETDKYLSPDDIGSRYPFPPFYLTDNYGLFISELDLNGYISAVGEVKYINPVSYKSNKDEIRMKVSFDEADMTKVHADLKKSFHGYTGMFVHPIIDQLNKDNRKNLAESLLSSFSENTDIEGFEFENATSKDFADKPLVINYDFTFNDLVNKAGNKYLFKMGKLIGRQVEMYQEEERQFPVEQRFQRLYDRVLRIKIPEGYQFANLDEINIKNKYLKDNKEIMSFHSYYEIEGDVLKVYADEFYAQNYVPVDRFEDYRRVINSAADFNNITLVLEPK